jgi:hypothetical protein
MINGGDDPEKEVVNNEKNACAMWVVPLALCSFSPLFCICWRRFGILLLGEVWDSYAPHFQHPPPPLFLQKRFLFEGIHDGFLCILSQQLLSFLFTLSGFMHRLVQRVVELDRPSYDFQFRHCCPAIIECLMIPRPCIMYQ